MGTAHACPHRRCERISSRGNGRDRQVRVGRPSSAITRAGRACLVWRHTPDETCAAISSLGGFDSRSGEHPVVRVHAGAGRSSWAARRPTCWERSSTRRNHMGIWPTRARACRDVRGWRVDGLHPSFYTRGAPLKLWCGHASGSTCVRGACLGVRATKW